MSYAPSHHTNQHDKIQRDLERRLRRYAKHELAGVVYDEQNRHNKPWQNDDIVKTEKQLSGDLPSGKDYCRIDVAAATGDQAFAIEVKTSEQDLMNWPTQRLDYMSVGLTPVIAVPESLIYEIAPGHQLVTDAEHIVCRDYEFHWVLKDYPPRLDSEFEIGASYPEPPTVCPGCGYVPDVRPGYKRGYTARCAACGWSE